MTAGDEQVTLLVPQGKIRCYVHEGVLRDDTPEEHVRQRVARSLVEEYGYAKTDLHLEFPVKMGSRRKKAVDIAVFPEGAEHQQENIHIIVETKRDDVQPTHRKEGVEQLKSYMAACLNVRWGLWVGSEMQAWEKVSDPKKKFIEATDIPIRGEDEPRRKRYSELVPATEGLSSVFKRCHNYLHVNGNLNKEKAFFEFLKLIFCKVHDEEVTSGTMRFSIAQEERRSELGQRKLRNRIEEVFAEVRDGYDYIFADAETIELDNRTLAYVVSELDKFNFQETSSDIKGEAYEEIVSVTSRRDFGAFFTPRNVCDMAVSLVLETYQPEDRLNLRIIDPACGTGGFLRAALLHLQDIIAEQMSQKHGGDAEAARHDTRRRLRQVCERTIFGIDKLPELVRAAQMNLAMHGDGSTNVYHANSLLPPGEWREEVRKVVGLGGFDVLFTNPPFGSKLPIDDPHILDQFFLSRFGASSTRSSMPPEQLFIERSLDFLRPGGRMAIVLPDSILSNPGLEFIRDWLMQRAYIIASIDLPKQMFARSDTGTLTSVLVLQKFTEQEAKIVDETKSPPSYDVFMSIVDEVGWDQRGNPVYVRAPSGEEVFKSEERKVTSRNAKGEVVTTVRTVEEPILDDELPAVRTLFSEWLRESPPQPWMR